MYFFIDLAINSFTFGITDNTETQIPVYAHLMDMNPDWNKVLY